MEDQLNHGACETKWVERCGGRATDKSRGGRAPNAAAARTTPDGPTHQAASSSSAIVSSRGAFAKRLADPTVEGEIPMSEIKRPGNARYSGVHGRMPRGRDGCYHNAQYKRRAAGRAASASHVGGPASRVGGAIPIQTSSHAAGSAASSSAVHAGTANQETQLTQRGKKP